MNTAVLKDLLTTVGRKLPWFTEQQEIDFHTQVEEVFAGEDQDDPEIVVE